jgi:PAS domain S-box-containing protein
MDLRGPLVQISPSCEAVLGYRPREMIGRSGADFIHPDHLENAPEMRALRGGQRPTIGHALHPQGRAEVDVLARRLVRPVNGSSSSAAT